MNELLVVLQNVDQIFNVIFVATLAGLSIMAAALLCPVCERKDTGIYLKTRRMEAIFSHG